MSVALLAFFQDVGAHGTEARFVQRVPVRYPNIANVYRTELHRAGAEANRIPVTLETIAGRSCMTGTTIGIDVDDKYGYDIDERVTLKVTYAVGRTRPFVVYWDKSDAEGLGRANPVDVSASGTGFSDAVIQLDSSAAFGSGLGWHRHRARNEGWPGRVRPRGRPLVRDPVSRRELGPSVSRFAIRPR